jgi:hypothetical protein
MSEIHKCGNSCCGVGGITIGVGLVIVICFLFII